MTSDIDETCRDLEPTDTEKGTTKHGGASGGLKGEYSKKGPTETRIHEKKDMRPPFPVFIVSSTCRTAGMFANHERQEIDHANQRQEDIEQYINWKQEDKRPKEITPNSTGAAQEDRSAGNRWIKRVDKKDFVSLAQITVASGEKN